MIPIRINVFLNKTIPFGAGGTAGRRLGEPSGATRSTALIHRLALVAPGLALLNLIFYAMMFGRAVIMV